MFDLSLCQMQWQFRAFPITGVEYADDCECMAWHVKGKGKGKGSPYSSTERRVPELIPVLGNKPAGDVSYKPGGRLPLLSARPAVTLATLKRAATSFAAWWTQARWVWTVYLRLLPDSVAAAIWTQALLLSPARSPLGYRVGMARLHFIVLYM